MNKQLTIVCLLLLIGFTSAAYKCLVGTNGCNACASTNDACTGCKAGWYLDATSKTCQTCSITGCTDCSDKTTCKAAAAGYALFSGAPVACGDGCASCTATSATDKTCGTASVGYFLKANVPTKCAANCAACSDVDVAKCTKPADGYFFDVGLGKCIIANCKQCPNNRTGCDNCAAGYVKSTTTPPTCDACIKNCLTCKDKTTCDQCAVGFRYDATAKACQACTVTGCAACATAVDTCDGCTDNQTLASNACLKCADNCISCATNGAGFCDSTQCAVGFKYNKSTKLCGKGCGVDNCSVCANNGACDTCSNGFGLTAANTSGTCGKCHDKCKATTSCNSVGAGKCEANNCVDGFAHDSSNNTCVACATSTNPGCNACTIVSGAPSCSGCAAGYFKNSSQCVSCTKQDTVNSASTTDFDAYAKTCSLDGQKIVVEACVDGYGVYKGKCYKCADLIFQVGDVQWIDKKAKSCTIVEPITATACQDGYGAISSVCTKCTVENCIDCSAAGTCTKCKAPYYLDTTCKHPTLNCIEYATTTPFACKQCAKGFYWKSNASPAAACVALENCTHTGTDACDGCDTGFKFVTDACASTTGCASYATGDGTNPGNCTGCAKNYYLDTTCKSLTNCIKTGTNACSQCDVGYYLDSTCKTSANCIESASGACSKCKAGNWLDSSVTPKVCKACSAGATCGTSSTDITGCLDDFYYNGTSCISMTGCKAATKGSDTTCTTCRDSYALFRGACRQLSNVKVLASGTVLTTNAALVTKGTIAATGVGIISGSCYDGATLQNSEVCLDCTASTTIFTLTNSVTTTGPNSNCITCTLSTAAITCSACASPFVYVGGTCNQCGANCQDQQCTSNGANKCDTGKCKAKFGLDSTNSCAACAANCSSCTSQGAGKCDNQASCDSGFFITSDYLCKTCAQNCASCTSAGGDSCDTCNTGYYLVSGKCSACYSTEKCATCKSASLVDCSPIDGWGKYFPSGVVLSATTAITTISQCVSNCKTCFGATFADCVEAAPKFFLDASAITKCPEGCDACSGSTPDKCTLSAGFYVDTTATPNAIKACPTGCAKCSVSGTAAAPVVTCSSCLPDWIFDPSNTTSKVCFMNCIANCEKCTTQDVNGCSACKANFTKGTSGCSGSGTTTTSGTTDDTTSSASLISTLFATLLVALILLF